MKLKTFKIIIAVILLFLIVFVVNKFFYQELKNIVFFISSPIQKFLWEEENVFSQWIKGIFESKRLKIENNELKKQNLSLRSEILQLEDLEEENKKLRKALDLGLEKEYSLILSDIISKKIEEDSILINLGRKDGVSEEMTAITEEKILIGKVGKVFDNFSQVILITQKDFSFSVEVETKEEQVLGAAQGQGNFKLKIEFLPKETQIKEGDMVITSVLGGNFPKNLLVGEIKTIKKSDVEPFQTGEIAPFFKKLPLENLFLIVPKEKETEK